MDEMDFDGLVLYMQTKFFNDMMGKNTLETACVWTVMAASQWASDNAKHVRITQNAGGLPKAEFEQLCTDRFKAMSDEVKQIILGGLMGYGENPPVGIPATIKRAVEYIVDFYVEQAKTGFYR